MAPRGAEASHLGDRLDPVGGEQRHELVPGARGVAHRVKDRAHASPASGTTWVSVGPGSSVHGPLMPCHSRVLGYSRSRGHGTGRGGAPRTDRGKRSAEDRDPFPETEPRTPRNPKDDAALGPPLIRGPSRTLDGCHSGRREIRNSPRYIRGHTRQPCHPSRSIAPASPTLDVGLWTLDSPRRLWTLDPTDGSPRGIIALRSPRGARSRSARAPRPRGPTRSRDRASRPARGGSARRRGRRS